MAIWVVGAGSHGENELQFIQENRVYITCDDMGVNVGQLSDRAELVDVMTRRYPDAKAKTTTIG